MEDESKAIIPNIEGTSNELGVESPSGRPDFSETRVEIWPAVRASEDDEVPTELAAAAVGTM